MTSAPSNFTVTSKTSAVIVGTFQAPTSVINNSTSDQVWIGTDNTVSALSGVPLQAQTAVQFGSQGITQMWAILDPAAVAPVQLVIGGDVTDWSPSPVKVVNISGPVAVTGTVAVSGTVNVAGSVTISGGSVNIGTISGTVTITGPVTVVNAPNVYPLSNLTILQNNFSVTGPLGSAFSLTGLQNYNSLIVHCHLQVNTVPGSPYLVSSNFIAQGFAGTFQLLNNTYYQQVAFGDDRIGLGASDITTSVIPLNAMDNVNFFLNPPANCTMFLSVFGTNAQLPSAHRSTFQIAAGVLYAPTVRMPVPTGTTYHIPLPITSSPVTLYMYSSGTGSGTPKTTVTITDTLSNVIRTYVNLNIAQSTDLPPIVLPHTLTPQYVSIQETGVAGSISQWENRFVENTLPVAA